MPAAIGVIPTAILAFLAADFGMWFSHFIRHKVPLFWQFHMVHHSQEKMSVLTDNRVHFVEAMVSATIVYLPLRLLGLSNEASTALAFATVFITGFTHANLRTHVGPMRWIMVTPQSHRVHHSDVAEHYDHNFGAVLSIWDRIFRTDWKDVNVYPSTGIGDPTYPLETNATWAEAPKIYAQQVAQPFKQVWKLVTA
jgi:sterol desaturase/sphingolipid hydroxylase (fatty acid hydroxylase superfamily)